MLRVMRPPDFFLVGAPKCGTTALYAMLGAHPGIFVSKVKEPDFFASDIRAAVPALAGRALDDWTEYLELFSHAKAHQKAGEGSVSYLASRVAAAAIRQRCPGAHIMMVLRDPADRLFSHYAAATAARSTRLSFPEWFTAETNREASDSAPIGPIAAGRYGAHLQKYFSVFPRSHIHITWYEDFVADAAAAVRAIFQFLEVDPGITVPVTVRLNETRVPRWPRIGGLGAVARVLPTPVAGRLRRWLTVPSSAQPAPTDRTRVIQLYENDLRLLGQLTNRDLSRWMDARG
jgi:hypothetical protein